MKKTLSNIFTILSVALILWVVCSWINTNSCNDISSVNEPAAWNLFEIIF